MNFFILVFSRSHYVGRCVWFHAALVLTIAGILTLPASITVSGLSVCVHASMRLRAHVCVCVSVTFTLDGCYRRSPCICKVNSSSLLFSQQSESGSK